MAAAQKQDPDHVSFEATSVDATRCELTGYAI